MSRGGRNGELVTGRSVALIVGIAVASLTLAGCGPDRASWVDQNNALIERVAVFPGASENTSARTTHARTSGLLGGTQGYYTFVVFRLPRGTTLAEFKAFWHCRFNGSGGGNPDFQCLHDDAEIEIALERTDASPPVYAVSADKGYQQDKDAGN